MFVGKLYPYQEEAVARMVDRESMLLAYEMGLGKTPMTIAALERMMENGQIDEPGIVVCLSSLKYQWAGAILQFTGGTTKALVVDGSPKQREGQYAQFADWENNDLDVLIMNYEQVVNDWKIVKDLPRGFVVIDEATAIKGFRSKRSKAIKKMTDAPVRFALTGTPIENGKPEEIYSIMQFVDDSVLGRYDLFDNTFIVRSAQGFVTRYRNIPLLHQRLRDSSVRKRQTDEDVRDYLPDVVRPDPVLVKMDSKGRSLYNFIKDQLLQDLEEAQGLYGSGFSLEAHYGKDSGQGAMDELKGRLMAKVGALRMLSDHPQLLHKSAELFDTQYETGKPGGSAYIWGLRDEGLLDGVDKAPKLEATYAYIRDFLDLDEHYKVVIFTSWLGMVDLLSDRMQTYNPIPYTGRLNAKHKEANKVKFQTDPDCRILVSSDAGGYGVDLPQANMLINYDLPWQSGASSQRNSRIIRASSGWVSVVVQDILMKGSIDERQRALITQKTAVQDALMDGHGINKRGGIDLSAGSLSKYLRENQV